MKEKPSDEKLNNMPYYKILREYVCESCSKHSFEIVKRTEKKRKVKCPHCKKNKLESYISDAPEVRVLGQNVGSLAEQNTKKLGRYEKDAKQVELEKNDHRNVNFTAEGRARDTRLRKIAKLKGEQKNKFLRGDIDV